MKLISTVCHNLDAINLILKLKEDGVEVFRVDIMKMIDPQTYQQVPSGHRRIIFRIMNEETETMLGLKYPAGTFRTYR